MSAEAQSKLRNSIVSRPSSLSVMGLKGFLLFSDCSCPLLLKSLILLFTRSLKKRFMHTCHTLKTLLSGCICCKSKSASSSTTTVHQAHSLSLLVQLLSNVLFCSLIKLFYLFAVNYVNIINNNPFSSVRQVGHCFLQNTVH